MDNLDLAQINDRLRSANIPVRVRLKGRNLALRATLPKKPGDGVGRKQYDISLRIPRTKSGLQRAEREAHLLAQRIADGSFNWSQYSTPQDAALPKTISQLIEEFKPIHLANNPRLSEATWNKEWVSTFRKLPQDQVLTESLLLAVVMSTSPNSRIREVICQRLQHLAKFAEIDIDLSIYIGDYEPSPRDIPGDDLIMEWRDLIPNPHWQWVFGMMATFGLRPHECFDCRFIDPLTVEVQADTKTGRRTTKAIPPEWVNLWGLAEGSPPPGKNRAPKERGASVNKQFTRYAVPMQPYDLRHAWAIRVSVVNGIPLATAAQWMGHSVQTHTTVYQKWLKASTNEQIYQSIILGKSSQPPS